ncbi:RNA-directed DNA polymerase, eukaryota, reverse transcriptase zinc-binding domain protein, partial [Tanacetum coccineum]
MSWYFTLLKHLHHSFVLDERVAWIEIGGLPLNAWTPKAFKKIVDSWGTPLFVDDDPKETVSTGRVCIKTKIHGQVNDYCKVVVLGKSYNVYVKEFAGWAPDIKATDSISCSNSEMGNSDKHEDNLNDNDLLDKEEGEIPNNNVNEEEEYVKNTQWTDRDTNSGKEQDNFPIEHLHSPKDKIEVQKEDSNSISKPPGFEAYNSNGKPFSSDGNHQSSKQPSHFSSAPVKSSRFSKSQNKSFGNHGSMIEAFVSHIEMGKVLGYDMEGSKNDFKKFIDSLGARQVEGNWIASHIHCYMINVYAPQDDGKKETLWNEITKFMNVNRGYHLIFGDFNMVRYASERLGTVFNHASANVFNQFIRDAQLWDIPLGGHLFTRINKHDHRPILLSPIYVDFGPTPFKFYNSWLLDKNLHSTISDFWENFALTNCANPIISFKNKMKALKIVIKDWYADLSVDAQRSSWIDSLRAIELKENMDFPKKLKLRHWIEDPLGIKDAFLTFYEQKFQKVEVVKIVNRSPFYKTLNIDQNTYLASSVLEADIRDAIWDCGSDKSPGPDGFTFAFYKDFWNVIKSDVMEFVHHFFNNGILPRGCNTSFITLKPKVLSLMVISDFRPISLIGAQYKIIAKVLANRLARVIDSVISHEQSAFIKQRQILDGPLMVNEVIQWCKRKKSKLMVFKINFEKAFDTISWDFLLQVMHFMGFSASWIKWILGCLHSASSSILINGSPTCEFNIHRGLRQGDPLSPFLFIIAMEGLHVAMEDAVTAGLYKGFKINTLNLSHLFFADDALFIGDWSRNNIKSLVSILECFHQVSGLKINYHKSKLFGIGVPFDEVALLASCTGCNALESPFSYLGLPIDCNMALVKSWDPISDKFAKCLSKWKAS